jgi:hypothetical protein
MSFSISVSLPHNEVPMPADPDEMDVWLIENNKYVLFEESLGGDHAVYHFWSGIATTLALPMIASIYSHGLQVERPELLILLERELDELEVYWNTHDLVDPSPVSAIRNDVKEHLTERMNYFREAIKIAREHRAVLMVV